MASSSKVSAKAKSKAKGERTIKVSTLLAVIGKYEQYAGVLIQLADVLMTQAKDLQAMTAELMEIIKGTKPPPQPENRLDADTALRLGIKPAVIDELASLGAHLVLSPTTGPFPICVCVVRGMSYSAPVAALLSQNFPEVLGCQTTDGGHEFSVRLQSLG